ncbi:MAG: FtsX-like permease family protein, partial [Acidimicrobiia bacterium]
MGAVRMCARSLFGRRWFGTLAVVLLIGIAGGAVLAALAGARRTESAYPRLLDATAAADLTVGTQGFGAVSAAEIAKLPQVAKVGRLVAFGIAARPEHGGLPSDLGPAFAAAGPNGVELYQLDKLQMVEGRLPRPDRVHEVAVNEIFARRQRLQVGDTYHADFFNYQELQAAGGHVDTKGHTPTQEEIDAVFVPVDLTVVGIGRPRGDLLVNENQDQSGIFLTPAFARKFASKIFFEGVAVKLRDPAHDLGAYEAAARKQFPDLNLDFQTTQAAAATFGQVVSPYADALRLFAAVVALTGLLIVAQALVRLVSADAADGPALAALGSTRSQRVLVSVARAAAVAILGATVAVIVAALASPLFPLGRARLADPALGFHVDWFVLGVGLPLIVAVLVAPSVLAAWRIARRGREAAEPWRPSRVAERVARAGGPVSAVSGVRFAVQRDRSSGATSLVTTLFGVVAAVAMIGAALVFSTNLDRLVTTPARYGWNWDALLDTYDEGATPDFVAKVVADHDLVGITVGSRATLLIDQRAVPAYGFSRVRGQAVPRVAEGRMPTGSREIALGAQTLRDLGKSVGDVVSSPGPGGDPVRLRIVGRTTLPSLSLNGSFGLGEGAAVTTQAMRALDPAVGPSFFLLDLRSGVARSTIHRRYSDISSTLGPQRPADIQSYDHVRATPLLLAGLLALLGVGALAHLLVTSIRSRRRDLAILKTLGLARRQVAATVAWQATTLVGIAVAVGIPVGLVAGRWIWRNFAESLGVDETLAIPVLAFVLIGAVAMVMANVIAALPARSAA